MPEPATGESSPLAVERSAEGFATIVLDRPQRLNTLTIAMRRQLADVVRELDADPAVRVLILTGRGRAFTAGLDLDEWDAGGEGAGAAASYVWDPVQALLAFRGPVIGAVNGLCLTGGLEIALSCDLLIACSEARFADTHVQVGLLPGWGGSVRLQQRIGLARAKEMAFSGRFVGASEALAWGLVNRVVPAARLRGEAEALARSMTAGVEDTVLAYKRLLDAEASLSFEQAIAHERAASERNNAGVDRATVEARLAALRGRGGR